MIKYSDDPALLDQFTIHHFIFLIIKRGNETREDYSNIHSHQAVFEALDLLNCFATYKPTYKQRAMV